jgi:hypothetical protein
LFWSAKFVPRVVGLANGIPVILGGIALAHLAVREMVRAKTVIDARKPTTEIEINPKFSSRSLKAWRNIA